MAVPAHDERDFEFWDKYKKDLPCLKTSITRVNESYLNQDVIAPIRP